MSREPYKRVEHASYTKFKLSESIWSSLQVQYLFMLKAHTEELKTLFAKKKDIKEQIVSQAGAINWEKQTCRVVDLAMKKTEVEAHIHSENTAHPYTDDILVDRSIINQQTVYESDAMDLTRNWKTNFPEIK